ncbi:MAG: flagellar biosynthetic protein FliR [Nitrospirota bacterium]|nr:flagellar biosynthetic protein FliR [Nitrospirota bacterium]
MMTQTLHIVLPQFQYLLVILVRIGGIMAAMPIVGNRSVPPTVRVGLALGLSGALLPVVTVPALPEEPLHLVLGLAAEFLVGAVIGIALQSLFAGIGLAGELMSTQMGFGAVQLLDPTTSHQESLVANLYTIFASLIFLSMDAHLMVVQAVATSFDLVAPFGTGLSANLMDDIVRLSQGLFLIALKMAAPVMVTILLVNLGMAVMGRSVSQMNVFLLSQPLTITAGLLTMGFALPYTFSLYESEFIHLEELLHDLMRMMGHG